MIYRILSTILLSTTILTAQKGAMILPESSLPEYEQKIDHAQLIKKTDKNTIKLGAEIYKNICQNCHGNHKDVGSVPTSLRFGSKEKGKFQHGNDPHTMYQTITRGWRTMPPQLQLTPREKYAVIHYIRKAYLKKHNPTEHFKVTPEYIAKLPKGNDLGPVPIKKHAWTEMDYGSFLINTYELATADDRKNQRPPKTQADYVAPDANIAYKGIAQRLDEGAGGIAKGKIWSTFEHDSLRVAGVWKGAGFIDWRGIHFDGGHVVRPRTIGDPVFETNDAPGWANPETGEFDDLRIKGLDGRHYGPLPRKWAHYKGLYQHGDQAIISYSVGDAAILESHQHDERNGFVRHLNIGKSSTDLIVRLSNQGVPASHNAEDNVKIESSNNFVIATIPASATPLNISFAIGKKNLTEFNLKTPDLKTLTKGGPAKWKQTLTAPIKRGTQAGAFQWDDLGVPVTNPWKSRLRTSGIDFSADGKSAYVCCWDGDVWKVDDFSDPTATHTSWRRIATGLFQPLGIVVLNEQIFVSCRDQIVRLHDLNADGETDYYESFNSDHQVTNHFHEFAMGLQKDEQGNLYYAKSARHARPPLVPHHGTLLKVSADGKKTDILANGFRAANGVCRNADGTFFVTDQEGHWNPMNRINHVREVKGGKHFYGNMWSYGAPQDSSDAAMQPPLCWVKKSFDRSPAELLWVDSKSWGDLNGKLLHLSYGHGRISLVPHETIDGKKQGGMIRMPIPDLPTGVMRGRFHSGDENLYLCGMAAWSTSQQQQKGGIYRVRATGKPAHLPADLKVTKTGLQIIFSDPISIEGAKFDIQSWAYKRSANYGSKVYDEKVHTVTKSTLSPDGKTLTLEISDLSTAWQMSVKYTLKTTEGKPVKGEIQNTIHTLVR